MTNRILDRPRIVDNEIFEGGNGFKVLLVQTTGFVSRVSDIGVTERFLQSYANFKEDADLAMLTVGRDADVHTKSLNNLSQFFPRQDDIPQLFKRPQEAAMVTLRKHDRNVALCTAIGLPTKREADGLMNCIRRYQDAAETLKDVRDVDHQYMAFADLVARGNLNLIDRIIRMNPRPFIREFLATRRQQLVRHMSDLNDVREFFTQAGISS